MPDTPAKKAKKATKTSRVVDKAREFLPDGAIFGKNLRRTDFEIDEEAGLVGIKMPVGFTRNTSDGAWSYSAPPAPAPTLPETVPLYDVFGKDTGYRVFRND